MFPAAEGARLRRSWPQRLLITFNCGLITLCVLAASLVGYSYYRFGNIPRVALGQFLTEDAPGRPQNYLLVGSDSRAFVEDGSDDGAFGDTSDVSGERADTIILVRIDPADRTVAMVSFPRDLWLPIAGTGGSDRINTALEGGPSRLIETIQRNFNVPVHHYIQVDFKGFQGLVDAAGGVALYLEHPVRDYDAATGGSFSGLDIDQTGCVTLDGTQALAYVRSRHFQSFVDGRWQADPTGDIGRIGRQQDFIRRAVRSALAKGLTNPSRLTDLLGVAESNVSLDEDLEATDILKLGRRFQSLEAGALKSFSLPTESGTTAGGASVEFLEEEKIDEILDVFRGVAPGQDVVQPSAVAVRVLNGSGRAGQAAEAAQALSSAGFSVANTGNATESATTTIRYAPGRISQAELLGRYLEPAPSLREDPTLESIDAVLVTGTDFTRVLATPRAPDAVPATSAAQAPPDDPELARPVC
jgi:LCP family protein required for cell wall assembly